MVKINSNIFLIAIIELIVIVSGCTGGQDVTQKPTITPTPTSTSTTPQASITVSQSESGLKLNHRGGDDLILGDVKIIIIQGSASAIYDTAGKSTDKFVAGDTLYITPTGISLNGRTLTTGKISIENSGAASGTTTITLIYLPNGKEIAKISFGGSFFSFTSITTPQSSIVIREVTSGRVRLKHMGGDSITLSDTKIVIEQNGASATYDTASESNDKFAVGDTLDITPTGISLNGKALSAGKISIERSGTVSGATKVTLIYLPNGKEMAKITFNGAFFS